MRKLVDELSKLPSIGERSAVRLAYFLITSQQDGLAGAIEKARENVGLCERCFFLTEGDELCSICLDSRRDEAMVCVVEKPADVLAIERSRGFTGLYHVLHGLWSPLRGRGPESTKLPQLLERIEFEPISELVLATGATVEGDATALYIAGAVKDGLKVTRIAQGIPKGGDLEYADEVTLTHALAGRRSV